MTRVSSIVVGAVVGALVVGVPLAAAAADDSGGIEEVVVTAQKRQQNIQNVPLSITAVSGAQLRDLNVTDTTQITQQIPGLHLNAWSPDLTIFNIRGVSQNNFTDYLEAPVAVYFDNAYMGSINGISGQLFDIKRIEVLRGPQGTLFGRNATGGLIQYLSNDASDAVFNGYVSASYARFNNWAIEGAVGGAITDHVRYRVAGRVNQADGYIKSAAALPPVFMGDGQDLGGANNWAIRGTLQFDLGSRGVANLWVRHSQDINVDTGGYVFDNCVFEANGYCHVNAAGLADSQTGVINGITGAPASPFQNFSNDRGGLNRDVGSYQFDFNYDLGDNVTLTSITNYTGLSKQYHEDGDAIPITVIRFATTADYRQFSQEVRLSGTNGPITWQTGAYYLDMRTKGTMLTVGAPVIGNALDLHGVANNPEVMETYTLNSRNWSLFGQADWAVSQMVTLTAGLRYSMDDKSIDYLSILSDTGFADTVLGSDNMFAATIPGVNRISHGDWAARAAVDVKPTKDLLLFASYNRGIKGGNWTLSPTITASHFRHKPEELNDYEAGFKWTGADGTLRLNGTAYYYDYIDYQAFALIGGTPQVNNSNATADGAELELAWTPTARWYLGFGATYEDSSVDRVLAAGSQIGPEFFPGAPSVGPCVNIGGAFSCTYAQSSVRNAKFPNAPQFSFNYLARYNFNALSGNIALQADGVYYDDQYLEVTNGLSSLQKAYGILNLSANWTSEDGHITFEVYGKNVTNTEYRVYTLNLGILGTTSIYGPPATWGVRLGYNW